MIYLDFAANTPANKEVLQKFIDVETNHPFNPNANNTLVQETKALYDTSMDKLAGLLGVEKSEIVMTSSATESNNMLIKGIAKHYKGKGKHIITTFLEHSSVNGPIGALIQEGYDVDYIDINDDGLIDMDHLKELLREDTVLVSICHVDSEIGLIQPINEIGQFVKENSNSFVHVDGTQALGKIQVELDYIDSYSFAAHKFYGINGCGGLVIKKGLVIEPLHHGGISSSQFRSGTPALGLIVSTVLALELSINKLDEHLLQAKTFNELILNKLSTYPLVRMNSNKHSIPYIINLSFKNIKGEMFKDRLAQKQICVSTKSACSAAFAPSRSVFALTKDRKAARSTLRVSLGHTTTIEEVEEFLGTFDTIYNELSS